MDIKIVEPVMTTCKSINSLSINSRSEWEEDPSKDGSGSHRIY